MGWYYMEDFIEVHFTAPSRDRAAEISAAVVKARLAACAQIFSPIESVYWWRDNIERASECFVVMKTLRENFDDLAQMVRANHSYEVPEIVAVPILEGTDDYLAWIRAETRGPGERA